MSSSTYKCCCCLEDLTGNKMPRSSLGCDCSIEVCCPCFLRDFHVRKKAYWVNEQGVSKWDDPLELNMFLQNQFDEMCNDPMSSEEMVTEANYDEKFEAFLIENFYVGKPCAQCCTTVLWKLTEVPAVSPTTGRMTMYAPKRVQQAFPSV